jgi:Helix-turn-helix domain
MVTEISGLTPSDAARELGLSVVRIRQLMSAGQLAYVRTPLGRLVDRNDLQRLQAERQAKRAGSERHGAR